MNNVTLVLPYYNQPLILRHQLGVINTYPSGVKSIVIDDGSKEKASDVFKKGDKASLYQIDIDQAWNLEGARNLGATVSETEWLIFTDIDHVLPADSAKALLNHKLSTDKWYTFPRYRVGKADSTRNRDALHNDEIFGEVHPHVNSYLITKTNYWNQGGCDEDYAGVIGGEAPFLRLLKDAYGESILLPKSINLQVFTRDAIEDANITTLDRDTSKYAEIRRRKGDVKAVYPLRFPWHKVI